MACNKIIGWDRRRLLSGKALNCRAPASVFKDNVVGFCFIAARKTAGSEGGNRGRPLVFASRSCYKGFDSN